MSLFLSLADSLRAGYELHKTSIRNENAYLSCIAQLFDYIDYDAEFSEGISCDSENVENRIFPMEAFGPPASSSLSLPRLFVVGDSHTLTYAWQEVTMKGKQCVLYPLLVTGVKVHSCRSMFFFVLLFFFPFEDLASSQ